VIVFGIWKNWFRCHHTLIPLVRNIPIIGTVFTTVALSRLSMTLSMLLNAGVDAKRSVQAAFRSTNNFYYIKGMRPALQGIEKGKSLGDSFRLAGVFPDEFLEAVDVGELSGSETESLEYLASDYLRRSRTAMTQLSVALSVIVWVTVICMLIFMILRMALQYVNTLNSLL
jgi:type IV pilus assembly protein PilC